MEKNDTFSACHPAVNFIFFALIPGLTVAMDNPVFLGVSLASALAYALCLGGRRAAGFALGVALPVGLMTAVINPAFSHEGATVLGYLPTGNPLTLESICYGLYAGGLMATALLWCYCLSKVVTSDKVVWLLGKAAPALGLVLAMTLRFVPRFREQYVKVREARKGAGGGAEPGGIPGMAGSAVRAFSITVTWALENAAQTADSMRGRGYGLPGRTAYSLYRLDGRDAMILGWMCFCTLIMGAGWLAGGLYWRYYPTVRGPENPTVTAMIAVCYLALCMTPVILEGWEEIKWRSLR